MEYEADTKEYFTFDYHLDGKQVTLRFDREDAQVPDVLEEFLAFLKACGYSFDADDYLDVVNDTVSNSTPSTTGGTMMDTHYPEPQSVRLTTSFNLDNYQNSNIFEWDSSSPIAKD